MQAYTFTTKQQRFALRAATLEDAADCYAVLQNVRQWVDEYSPGQWVSGAHDQQPLMVSEAIAHGGFYVLESEGQIVATIRLTWAVPVYWQCHVEDTGYISTFAVHRSCAGLGVGDALLQWAEARIHAQGKSAALLDCYAGNHGLCQYYEARGYQRFGQIESYPGYMTQFYRKPLL